jgi:hypothetical protein
MTEEQTAEIPALPCPACGENLLTQGFYNHCSETTRLREDNYTYVSSGNLYIDHDEKDHETVDHECEMEARCTNCDADLPWPLYQLRGLDGEKLDQLPALVAELLAELNDAEPTTEPPNATEPAKEHHA